MGASEIVEQHSPASLKDAEALIRKEGSHKNLPQNRGNQDHQHLGLELRGTSANDMEGNQGPVLFRV